MLGAGIVSFGVLRATDFRYEKCSPKIVLSSLSGLVTFNAEGLNSISPFSL